MAKYTAEDLAEARRAIRWPATPLAWLPVDWRLLAPFFLLGAAAGAIAILWLFAVALGHGA